MMRPYGTPYASAFDHAGRIGKPYRDVKRSAMISGEVRMNGRPSVNVDAASKNPASDRGSALCGVHGNRRVISCPRRPSMGNIVSAGCGSARGQSLRLAFCVTRRVSSSRLPDGHRAAFAAWGFRPRLQFWVFRSRYWGHQPRDVISYHAAQKWAGSGHLGPINAM